MHPAPSLILFTTLSGLGFGLLAFLCLGLPDARGLTAVLWLGAGFALAGGGLLASTAHLGNPQRRIGGARHDFLTMGHLELAGRVIGEPQQRLVLELKNVLHQRIGFGHVQVTVNIDGTHAEFLDLHTVTARGV